MNDDKKHAVVSVNGEEPQPISSISQALGIAPILPGEDEELYRQGLTALIAELEAKTLLQVYLAEKIFDCLWWLRRYEEQKRSTIIIEMAVLLSGDKSWETASPIQIHVRDAFFSNKIDKTTQKAIAASGHTILSLRKKAMEAKHEVLQQLDQQIALQTKILAGLQASFEVAFHRKLNTERLMLQNELLRKDVTTIDISSEQTSHEEPKTGSRKPA